MGIRKQVKAMQQIQEHITVPVVMDSDVAVCGGGIAGAAAALAAARSGSRVLLIEQSQILGGLAIPGLVTIYLPLCDGMGHQVSFGIAEELLRLSIRNGAQSPLPQAFLEGKSAEECAKTRYEVQYNPWFFAIDLEQLLQKEGVRILYDTKVCGVRKEEDQITHLILENIDGRTAIRVKSVVDATGSAAIARQAGAPCAVYSGGNVLSSWYYLASRGKVVLRHFGEKNITGGQGPEDFLGNVLFSGLDARENSEVLILSRKYMLDDMMQYRKDYDPKMEPVSVPLQQDVRMTRRIDGVKTMSIDTDHVFQPDSVGCFGHWYKKGPAYEIPYGALCAQGISNLWAAGRCISTDDEMWDLTRVIPVCAVTGQAAGTAASLFGAQGNASINCLQQKLASDGVMLHLD